MSHQPLSLGSSTTSRESYDAILRKVDAMLTELYATTSEGDLSSISQNIVPDGSNTRDLGSQSHPWRTLYVVTLDGGNASSTFE